MHKATVTLDIVDIGVRTKEQYDQFCNVLLEVNKHAIEKFSKGDMQVLDFHMDLQEPAKTPEAEEYVKNLTSQIKAKKSKIILPGGK